MDQSGLIPDRPLPAIEQHARPFWDGLRQHRLMLTRCDDCGMPSHPPETSCPGCGSVARSWVEASGRATLWSWTICYPPMLPWFAQYGTWLVAVAQLEEGPRVVALLRDLSPEELHLDMPLQVGYDDIDDEMTLLAFRPI